MQTRPQTPALRVVGRYVVQHEIATGGMATVYLGKLRGPVGFSPIVAIKALHPHFAKEPEFVRMFLDEARLAARIRHANVVPVLDVHEGEGELFLVLEYIHGDSLAQLLRWSRREHQLPSPGIASAIMCDVLHGLHAAHEAKDERGDPLGIVHRDVSPQNVLVGADGVARVFDFGVAKAAGRITTTTEGHVKGKFAYMAPEQLRGERINRQADVYSAAVVLWETLTGDRLFKAESEGNTVERALFAPVAPPSTFRPDLPAGLDAVVMRGLARERSQRFATAREMAVALQACVAPASPPEVGDWVEGLAFEALEGRKRRIAEIEAGVAASDASAAEGSRSGPPPPLERPVAQAPTEERSSAEVSDAAGRALTTPASRETPRPPTRTRSTTRALLVVGAVAIMGLGITIGLGARTAPLRTAPPATPPVAAEAPLDSLSTASTASPGVAPLPPSTTSAQAMVDPVSSVPSPGPAQAHASTPKGTRVRTLSGKHSTGLSPTARPSPGDRCTRRNAEGVIEFDTECLREAQRTP